MRRLFFFGELALCLVSVSVLVYFFIFGDEDNKITIGNTKKLEMLRSPTPEDVLKRYKMWQKKRKEEEFINERDNCEGCSSCSG